MHVQARKASHSLDFNFDVQETGGSSVRLRGFRVWQRANYEPFADEMLRRRNLNDTSKRRKDDNPPRPSAGTPPTPTDVGSEA